MELGCWFCGKKFEYHKAIMFCSMPCLEKWRAKKLEQKKQEKLAKEKREKTRAEKRNKPNGRDCVICGKDLKGQQQKYCSKDCQYYYQRKEGAMRKASREKREEKFFAENAKKDFSDVESFDIPDYKGTRYWDSMWRGNK